MSGQSPPPLTYRDAGVDIDAGNELVRRIGDAARRTHRPELLGGLGGFAALATLPAGYREPVLVTGTDGVGTKLQLALEHDRHDRIGQDLVAMCVNDVITCGAEPFLFLDYFATGSLDVAVASRVINGIAAACEACGCALVGGETAEMPGLYRGSDYDLAGFCVGVVERDRIVSGEALTAGDRLVGLASSGAHSNGYSLIRRILESHGPAAVPGGLDALMTPTRLYARAVGALREAVDVHGMAHVTGGGLVENLPRMLTDDGLGLLIDLGAWPRPALFEWLAQAGPVAEADMLRTFNCGVGFVVAVPADALGRTLEVLTAAGETAFPVGEVVVAEQAAAADGRLLLRRSA